MPARTTSGNVTERPDAPRSGSEHRGDDANRDPDFVRRGRVGVIVAMGITAVNGYIFYNWQLANSGAHRGDTRLMKVMTDNFTCSKRNLEEGRYWTLLTSGFSHIEVWHLLANTLGIVSFVPAVAISVGITRTVLIYLSSIGAGSIASLYHAGYWDERSTNRTPFSLMSRFSASPAAKLDTPGLGASAGVFGIFTLSVILAPKAGVSIFFIPLPAWFAWGLLTGIDSYCAISQDGRRKMTELTGVQMGHEAHLGGSAAALLLSLVLIPRFWLRR